MERKKLTPIEKHSARTFIMFIFLILFWGIVSIIFETIINLVFHIQLNGMSGIGLAFGVYLIWKTNIRFGWVENLIEGKKKYPQLSGWFAEVTGK